MFTPAAALDKAQVTGSIHKALKKWADTEDTWLDDNSYIAAIESIDRRLAMASGIISTARRVGGQYPSDEFVEVLARLEDQKRGLASLRDDLLNGVSGRQDGGVLASLRPSKPANIHESRWVELEASSFLRDNADVVGARWEMAERAYRYAEKALSHLDRTSFKRVSSAFVWRVDALNRAAPRQRVAKADPVRQDFSDSSIFL